MSYSNEVNAGPLNVRCLLDEYYRLMAIRDSPIPTATGMELMHLPTVPVGCNTPCGWSRKEWRVGERHYLLVFNKSPLFKLVAQIIPATPLTRFTRIGQYEIFVWAGGQAEL